MILEYELAYHIFEILTGVIIAKWMGCYEIFIDCDIVDI